MRTLTTTAEVIEELGGFPAIVALTGCSETAPYNWKNAFPSKTYVVIQAALAERGYTAPDSLWNMVGSEQESERRVS